jgi:biotin carboxyl carrier protein
MYHITVNKKFKHEVDVKKGSVEMDSFKGVLDIKEITKEKFHVLMDNASHNAEVVSVDYDTKTCVIRVNHTNYSVEVKDQFDDLLHQLGMDDLNTKKVNDIKAPMPGLVLKVLVQDGQTIKKGDNLLVLEAMKMENIIKAPADGTIKSIKVVPSEKVEKNQVLINL